MPANTIGDLVLNKIPSSERLEIRNICSHSDHLGIFCVSNGGVIKFHNPSEDETWISTVTTNLAELKIFCGYPTSILEVTDAIFVPDFNCLYDSEGHRILESCIRRGILLNEIIGAAPENIIMPKCVSSVELPLVYLGPIDYHWGHFLTESISRLWCLDGYLPSENNLLLFGATYFNNGEICDPVNKFLSLGTLGQATYKGVAGPIKMHKAFVPLASFSNRGEAYSAHTIFPHRVAERLLIGRAPKSKSNRPVYLSRSRLSRSATGRVIRNEAQFENLLKSFDVLICYPETMSLEEQVLMFNEYTTFVGCWGSAFHNLIFCLDLCGVTVHILSGWRINPNYLLFDAILGLESHYINCLRPTPGVQQLTLPMIDMYIDIDLTRSYLSENQII